ncbi:MAG: hypothetical protein NZM25_06510 [Leptospiraceae bacterium]|nr:hypothetical protein [Leptospiraceae bacterium]
MKKIYFIAVLSLCFAQGGYAYLDYLNRSLPNQAGVKYDYLLDQWDFAVRPVFFSGAKSDVITAFYSADPNGNEGKFNLASRTSLGALPLYWAVQFNNEGTETTEMEDTSTQTKIKLTEYKTDTYLQVGSLFGGFGINLFARLKNNGNTETETTTAGVKSTTKDLSKTENAFGLNLGQGSERFDFFWSVGVEYRQEGGDKETVTGGSRNLNTSGGNPDTADIGLAGFRLRTVGRLPLTTNKLLAGWRAAFQTVSGKAEHISASTKIAQSEKSLLGLEDLAFYLTQVLPITDNSRFLANEEIALAYVSEKTTIKVTAGPGKSESTLTGLMLNIALPLIFQINITPALLLNAGWYPKLVLVDSAEIKKTTVTAGGTTTTQTAKTSQAIYGTGDIFGVGLSYLVGKSLRVHFNATPANTANAGNLSFGADYIF